MTQVDLAFPSMGGEARVRLESVRFDEAELAALADGIHSQIEAIEAALSRFDPDSELSRLNRDPRPAVPASPLLRRAVAAALWAADYSDGLVGAGFRFDNPNVAASCGCNASFQAKEGVEGPYSPKQGGSGCG